MEDSDKSQRHQFVYKRAMNDRMASIHLFVRLEAGLALAILLARFKGQHNVQDTRATHLHSL